MLTEFPVRSEFDRAPKKLNLREQRDGHKKRQV